MKYVIAQLISFILPITALVLIPLFIEPDIAIKNVYAFITGCFLMFIGLSVMAQTIASFIRKGKGTLAPWSPTQKLIFRGLYAYVRNPMILGVLTVLIGESITILSLNILIWTVIFFIANTLYFIIYEEPNLEKRFGDEYREYKRNVNRWFPRSKPFTPDRKS